MVLIMTILVTGAAGFIGQAVAQKLLQRGEAVVGLDNLNDYYAVSLKRDRLQALKSAFGDAFSFCPVDVADASALSAFANANDFERIVHLAAQAGVRYSLENPAAYVQSNLVGHANMLELARKRGTSHMVYASSSSIYGSNSTLPFHVEDQADHPLSFYAATKKSNELMSEAYAHLYSLPLTGLRFFTVYGPWGRPDMALWIFTEALFKGRPLSLFNGGNMKRDFTYIDDVVSGLVACLDDPPQADGCRKPGGSKAAHRIYNIGNSRSEEVRRVIGLLEQATGRQAIIQHAPMHPGDMLETYADVDAIARDQHYAPITTIEEGVPLFVNWFRAYHRL